jgi:exopolysaccharide biosynthesis polyprenyl glycosylphosphotransferase
VSQLLEEPITITDLHPTAAAAASTPTDVLRIVGQPAAAPAQGELATVRRTMAAIAITTDLVAAAAGLTAAGLVNRTASAAAGARIGAWAGLAFIALIVCSPKQNRCNLSSLHDARRHLAGLAVLTVATLIAFRSAHATQTILVEAVATAGMAVTLRALAYAGVRQARRRGQLTQRAVIVGAGEIGRQIGHTLSNHPEYGIEPVAVVDDNVPADCALEVDGGLTDLRHVVAEANASRVIVAFGAATSAEAVPTLRQLAAIGVEVDVVPRFFELGVGGTKDCDFVWGIPLQRLRRPGPSGFTRAAKRAFDLTVASALLIAVSPVLAACALAVKLTSRGPVLFRQRRIGAGGRPIDVFKFRSMRVNTDSDTTWSVLRDSRVTPVGDILRRSSLDELPQLWNVIRGDMSLVGPRPERPHFVEQFSEDVRGYDDRHRVGVGLTGWAQIHGLRGPTSIVDRARFDNYYIEHWSMWRDIVILVRTFVAVLRDLFHHGVNGSEKLARAGGQILVPSTTAEEAELVRRATLSISGIEPDSVAG